MSDATFLAFGLASVVLAGSVAILISPSTSWFRLANAAGPDDDVQPEAAPARLEPDGARGDAEPASLERVLEVFRAVVADDEAGADPMVYAEDDEPPFEIAARPAAAEDCAAGLDPRCKMDLAATSDGLELSIELPGVDDDDVQIEVTGDILTVRGELRGPEANGAKTYRLTERDYGVFSRSIDLPEGVPVDQIRADLSRGVLTLSIPNPVRPEPRRIAVSAAPLRLAETGEGLELSLDLPGLEQDAVEVTVCEGILSVRGAGGAPEARPAGFSGSVALPPGVDPERIRAVMGRGVLTVSVPSPVRPDPKRIEVLAA